VLLTSRRRSETHTIRFSESRRLHYIGIALSFVGMGIVGASSLLSGQVSTNPRHLWLASIASRSFLRRVACRLRPCGLDRTDEGMIASHCE